MKSKIKKLLAVRYLFSSERGFAAIYVAIIVLIIMAGIALSLLFLVVNQQKILGNSLKSYQSFSVAEAGIEDALYRIKNGLDISSDYSIAVGSGLVNVLVDSPNSKTKIITATGNIKNIFRKLELVLVIDTISPQFFYGAQAGDLGIIMENNSRIEGAGGTTGNLYSNGSVDGAPGATITGDVFVASGMEEDATHTVYNSDQIFGEANPIIDIAQSFRPSVSNNLAKVSVYVKKEGKPGSRTVRILTDSGGSPSKTSLGSGTLYSSSVGTSYGWVDVIFSSPPSLTAGQSYWIMIDADRNNKDYWFWGKDKNLGYGNGVGKYTEDWNTASPSWTTITGDLNFKIYMGGSATFLDDVIVSGNAHANTISNSKICGDGYYQAIDQNSLDFLNTPSNPTCADPLSPGTAFPGSIDPPLANMPISDSNINQWKKEAESGGTHSGDLVVNTNMSFGPQKIDGNLIMTGNKKTLTITGTVYVAGHIDISNGSTIRCSPTYGLYSCVIIADQWIHLVNNGIFQGSGQPGSYLMILSTSPCIGILPGDCTDFNAAMDIHNNVSGAIFYAHNGLIYLHNGVEATELTGRKIHLENTATVRYEQGLVNSEFSSGPGGSWQVASWKEIE